MSYENAIDYDHDSPKKGRASSMKNYYILGGLLLLFVLSFSLFFYPSGEEVATDNEKILLTCGDGTFSAECSLNRPYYCDGGELVYDIRCRCPEPLKKNGDICDSEYFKNEKDVTLKYILDGEEKEIEFTVYEEVSEYLDTKHRSITYSKPDIKSRADFKLAKIDDEIQRESLMGLVVAIQNAAPDSVVDQARIATSIVQNIEYKESEKGIVKGGFSVTEIRLARYPYQVIERGIGSCEGKSELLVFLLREIGYSTAVFYYNSENHEAVGIKCPIEKSLAGSGYCFVETTVPAPISYSTGNYLIGEDSGKKLGDPKIFILSKGISLPEDLDEYKDVEKIESIYLDGATSIQERASINPTREKYGMPKLEIF